MRQQRRPRQEAAVRCPRCPRCPQSLSFSVCLPVECLVGPFSRQLFQGINIGIDGIDIDDCWPYLNGSLIDLLVVVMTAFVLRRESSGYLLSLYGQCMWEGKTEREREGAREPEK